MSPLEIGLTAGVATVAFVAGQLTQRRRRPDPAAPPQALPSHASLAHPDVFEDGAGLTHECTESLLDSLLANGIEGIVITDDHGKILRCNEVFTKLVGRPTSAVIGRPLRQFMDADSNEKIGRFFSRTSSDQLAESLVSMPEITALTPDRRCVDLHLTVSTAMTRSGQLTFLFLMRDLFDDPNVRGMVNTDIQKRLRAAKNQVQAMRHRLETTKLDLANLTYTVSHDLRTPAVNMVAFAELITQLTARLARDRTTLERLDESDDLRVVLEDQLPKALDFLHQSGQRLQQRIEAMVKLSRLGTCALMVETLDLGHELQRDIIAIVPQCDRGGVRVDLPDNLWISTDRQLFKTITKELIRNAYTHRHPDDPFALAIRGELEDRTIKMSFTDHGRGIHENDLPNVFQMFKTGHHKDSDAIGCGLSFCKRAIERLDGRIDLRSSDTKGTVVTISIPQQLDENSKSAA